LFSPLPKARRTSANLDAQEVQCTWRCATGCKATIGASERRRLLRWRIKRRGPSLRHTG